MRKVSILVVLVALVGSAAASSSMADPQSNVDRPRIASQNNERDTSTRHANTRQVAQGVKTKVTGVIVESQDDSFILRDQTGSEVNVRLSGATKIQEKKSNPFRGAKRFSRDQVIRGLNVEVEGRGDASGALAAERIKFSDTDLKFAMTVESQVVPVENRVGEAEERLTRSEENAQRLSGQVQELTEVSNLARGGALAAQESADAAIDGVNRTNDRISALDEYEVRQTVTVNFRVGSAVLNADSKTKLDEIATHAKTEKGYVIEVRGFASSDGSESLNRRLSERRSDAVIRYLAETHDIPLRRMVLPFGYGEAAPVADNTTRDGRQQNRRAEIRILISRGLTAPVNVNRSVSSNSSSSNNNQK